MLQIDDVAVHATSLISGDLLEQTWWQQKKETAIELE